MKPAARRRATSRATSRAIAAAIVGATAAAAAFAWFSATQPSESRNTALPADEFCLLAPVAAHATPDEAANVAMSIDVPLADPAIGQLSPTGATARQGDVVRVSVASPRDGGITVHGLSDVRPIAANGHVSFEFRAIYSGRFPVHFHGLDGSHIEVAAFEVMPPSVALLK